MNRLHWRRECPDGDDEILLCVEKELAKRQRKYIAPRERDKLEADRILEM